jgi:hypothetical protein
VGVITIGRSSLFISIPLTPPPAEKRGFRMKTGMAKISPSIQIFRREDSKKDMKIEIPEIWIIGDLSPS